MEPWVLGLIALIVGSIVFCWIRKNNFVLITCAVCAIVFVVVLVVQETSDISALDDVAFMPDDLTNPPMLYTVLTSMYAHVSFQHILFNVLALVFIGVFLEQGIGTRPVAVIYLLTGLVGTLTFAVVNWDTPFQAAVGASGAISGILGAAARLYPNERFSLMGLIPMPLWALSVLFVFIQLLIALSSSHIAWEAHVGGLAAGFVIAPMVAKVQFRGRVKKTISQSSLRKLATTPELKSMLKRIESEEIPDVRSAWIEQFLSRARCPHCGSSLKTTRDSVMCEKGHII